MASTIPCLDGKGKAEAVRAARRVRRFLAYIGYSGPVAGRRGPFIHRQSFFYRCVPVSCGKNLGVA